MVSQVGLNTSCSALYNPYGNTAGTTTNLYNNSMNYGLTSNTSFCTDDLMMSNLDFGTLGANQQTAGLGTVQTSTQNPLTLNTQFQTSQTQQLDTGELAGYLQQRDKNVAYTENGNRYQKTNAGKTIGGVFGFLAPVAGKIKSWFRGGNFKDLFKFKQLAIVCPALAAAGIGAGALIDGFYNNKKAAAADAGIREEKYNF